MMDLTVFEGAAAILVILSGRTERNVSFTVETLDLLDVLSYVTTGNFVIFVGKET